MSAEQINEIALMSAEDRNVAVAPIAKKVRKPKIECCACNEMFKDSEICRDAYDDAWCYDCYDDEYKKCIMCDMECPLDKEDEEWFDRDGDCYCEDCKDEYDAEEDENTNVFRCDGYNCGKILHLKDTTEWKYMKTDWSMLTMVCLCCAKNKIPLAVSKEKKELEELKKLLNHIKKNGYVVKDKVSV